MLIFLTVLGCSVALVVFVQALDEVQTKSGTARLPAAPTNASLQGLY